MTTFPDREHGFEAKFAHDEEIKFRATARRDGLLAHWASQKLGLVGAAADNYVKQVLTADLDNPGTDSVFKKIRKALMLPVLLNRIHKFASLWMNF